MPFSLAAAIATCPRLMPPSFGGTWRCSKHLEAGALQPLGGALGEQAILEAAAGQRHPPLSRGLRHRHDRLHQRVVESRSHDTRGDAATQVGQHGIDEGAPVEDDRRPTTDDLNDL